MLQRDSEKGITLEDAKTRLGAQKPLLEKLAFADVVINNESEGSDGSTVNEQIDRLVSEWCRRDKSVLSTIVWLICWLCPPVGLMYGAAVIHYRAQRARKNA